MSAPANYNWRRSRQKDLQQRVGHFYEHLVAATLECEISERGHPELADLISHEFDFRVDVKARGDNNTLDLRVDQLDVYKEDMPFPLSYTLYALVPYRSSRSLRSGDMRPRSFSKKTKMISLLRGLKTNAELHTFLAENAKIVYLLDLEIVTAIKKRIGTQVNRLAGRQGVETVSVGRKRLAEFFLDTSFTETLRSLKLQPSAWAKGVYPTKVGYQCDGRSYISDFTLVTVLRKRLHADMATVLARKALTLT